jgi:hypothetical protein
VTEAEWLAATDPRVMLESLRAHASESKVRLFDCAWRRRNFRWIQKHAYRRLLEVDERYADGSVSIDALISAYEDAGEDPTDAIDAAYSDPYAIALLTPALADANAEQIGSTPEEVRAAQCALIRELFGNPFRPAPAVAAAWLAWRGGTVRELARACYEQRLLPGGQLDAARLAVLADALEDAGCTDPELLGHLRSPGPHFRGCRALDLLLGKG